MNVGHLQIVKNEELFWIVKNTQNNKFVKLGQRELKFLLETLNIDDKNEISWENSSLNGELMDVEKNFLIQKFAEWGFTNNDKSEAKCKKRQGSKDWSKIKILQINPERVLKKIPFGVTCLFSGIGLLGILLFSLAKYFVVASNMLEICEAVLSIRFSLANIVIFIILFELSTILHEFGHAFSCMYYGGKITSMGVLLHYLFPALYCDVSDIYLKGKKSGIMCQLGRSLCKFIIWYVSLLELLFYKIFLEDSGKYSAAFLVG